MTTPSPITSPYAPDLAAVRAWLEKMIASRSFIEIVIAILALISRMRDVNTDLVAKLAYLKRKRPPSETLERLKRQLVLPLVDRVLVKLIGVCPGAATASPDPRSARANVWLNEVDPRQRRRRFYGDRAFERGPQAGAHREGGAVIGVAEGSRGDDRVDGGRVGRDDRRVTAVADKRPPSNDTASVSRSARVDEEEGVTLMMCPAPWAQAGRRGGGDRPSCPYRSEGSGGCRRR
jgi:hypothetical protein